MFIEFDSYIIIVFAFYYQEQQYFAYIRIRTTYEQSLLTTWVQEHFKNNWSILNHVKSNQGTAGNKC